MNLYSNQNFDDENNICSDNSLKTDQQYWNAFTLAHNTGAEQTSGFEVHADMGTRNDTTARENDLRSLARTFPSQICSSASLDSDVFNKLGTIRFLKIPSDSIQGIEFLIPWVRSVISDKVASRISDLYQMVLDGDLEDEEFSFESLYQFLIFMQKRPEIIAPSIVLTPVGNIQARWVEGKDELLTAEFLDEGMVNFVLFKKLIGSKVERVGGLVSADKLEKQVEVYNASYLLSWETQRSYLATTV